jgi:hypothetical protein
MRTGVSVVAFAFYAHFLAAEEVTPKVPVAYPVVRYFVEGGRFVTALALDGEGGFWVGSEDKGLHYCDGVFWHEVRTPYPYEHAVSAATTGESVWLGLSRSGAAEMDKGGTWRFHDILTGLGAHRVNGFAWDKSGQLWAATDHGVRFYNGLSWSFAGRPPGDEVTSVVSWGERILAGAALTGVWAVSAKRMERFSADGLPDKRICDLAVGPSSTLWAGTFSGPAFLAQNKWVPVALPVEARSKDEEAAALDPQSQAVLGLTWDGKDGLFMATRTEGILYYCPKSKEWRQPTPNLGNWGSYVHKVVFDDNGSIWAATNGAGVARFEKEGLVFWDGKTALRCVDERVQSSAGWTYGDRSTARSLGQFLLGRVLRMAQTDAAKEFICLYFDGLNGVTMAPAAGTAGQSAYRGAVLLEYASGKVVWSHDAMPRQPVRWSGGGLRAACRTSAEQVVVTDVLSGKDRTCSLSVDASRFYFLDGQTVLFEAEPRSAKLVLTGESGSWSGLSREELPADPSPLERFRRVALDKTELEQGAFGKAGEGSREGASSGTAALHGLEVIASEPVGDHELSGGESMTFELPKSSSRPLVFFSFQYKDTNDAAKELAAFDVVVESGRRARGYKIDEFSAVPKQVVFCVPTQVGETPKLRLQTPRGRKIKLTGMKWLAANIKGSRSLPEQFRIRDERAGLALSPANPAIHVKSPDGSGITVQRLPFGKHELDFLFDGTLEYAGWKAPEGALGWSLEIAFADEAQVEGVVTFGTAGLLSQQMEGLCIEVWEGDAESATTGKWRWHTGVVGTPQFQYGLFQPCTTRKIRVTGLSRKMGVTELMVFAREPDE